MIDYTAMAEQLNGEYRKIFEKAELYSDMNGIQEEIKADRLMNLLDLLATAEADQKPAVDIIGTDIEKFCKEYFSCDDTHHTITEITEKIYDMMRIMLFVLILDILFLEHPTKNIIYMKSNILPMLSGIMFGVLLSILLQYLIGPIIFRSKKIPSIIYYFLVLLLWIMFSIAAIKIIGERNLSLPSFPFLVISILYITIYLMIRSVIRYRKTGSIRKPKLVSPEYEFHLTKINENSKDLENAVQKGLVKRFQRINKKRSRRNQPAMTTQEFIKKIRKEEAVVNPICIWGLGIAYIAMGVGMLSDVIRTSGLEFDLFIFPAVFAVFYVPLFLFIRHCILQGAKEREKILVTWESKGVTILEKKQDRKEDSPESPQS